MVLGLGKDPTIQCDRRIEITPFGPDARDQPEGAIVAVAELLAEFL